MGTDPLHQFCQEKEASPSGVCPAPQCILVLLHGGVPPTKKKVRRVEGSNNLAAREEEGGRSMEIEEVDACM